MSRASVCLAALCVIVILGNSSEAFSTVAEVRVRSIRHLDASSTTLFAADVRESASIDAPVPEECPRGYYLNSVKDQCSPLGPLGLVSQVVETSWGPLRKASKGISNLFGIDTTKISALGVGFALSYSILSTINGAVSLSFAWYLSCKRVRSFDSLVLYFLDDESFAGWSDSLSNCCFHLFFRIDRDLSVDGPFSSGTGAVEIVGRGVWNYLCYYSIITTVSRRSRHCHVETVS
jgi:hypothetical protein